MAVFTTDHDRQTFRNLYKVSTILREIEKDMPMTMASIFLWVALNEGGTQADLRLDLDLASSTSSRNLAALSKVHRLGVPGHGLIEWVENPEDRRAKLLFLSTKGKALVGRIMGHLA